MNITPARLAAYEILFRIEKENAFSSVLLPIYEAGIDKRDRALVHELVLGVIRRKLYLDFAIEKFSGKKTDRLDLEVMIALRLGLYQMMFLDKIPASAAANESVNLVARAKKKSAKGFVNAVLRNAAREQTVSTDDIEDETVKLSIETSHPVWLIEKWIRDLGVEETKQLIEANNRQPKAAFRLTQKSAAETAGIIGKIGLDLSESKILSGAWTVRRSNEVLRALAEAGKIYFQDESSQLVAELIKMRIGERFWDVCAAPGSKATFVSMNNMKNAAGIVQVAGDVYLHRIRTLRENCRNVGADRIRPFCCDAEKEVPFGTDTFDHILVDAPCSGTGTIRNNPEIRYTLRPEDFSALAEKQLKILFNASKTLKTGGVLIYSTCSLEPEENEEVVRRFLSENPYFQKLIPELPRQYLTEEGFGRIFPHRDNTAGFFIAVLARQK